MNAKARALGNTKKERDVKVVELTAGKSRAVLWSFGARIVELHVPKDKATRNILVSAQDPTGKPTFAGAAIGRVANLTENARFELFGTTHSLDQNRGEHHIHGGYRGFHSRNWELLEVRPHEAMARFYTRVRTEEDGYPGMLEVTLTYRLTGGGLNATYRAQSSHNTLFAPTIHPYFNLSGERKIDRHFLEIPLPYRQILEGGLPKGRPIAVKGWNDLRKRSRLATILNGPRIRELNHCWLSDGLPAMRHLTSLSHENGLKLEVHSTMPAIQVYTGDQLKTDSLRAWSAIALLAGYPPNSANRAMKHRIALKAGEARMEQIEYRW